jgi:alpha-L-fucosidase
MIRRTNINVIYKISLFFIIMNFIVLAQSVKPPEPYGALPSSRQLEWHDLGFYGFIHYTVNAFTDKEWGYGDENPEIFNPSKLDVEQWARVARDAGMKGLILTAKHHDGFCLWPSKYTEHSIKNSPVKNHNIVKELSQACKKYGLKFGVYLSPWDRNHAEYGRPAYIDYYKNQLTELLTENGDIFEVWFDGANGGDGYFGGAREKRIVETKSYYHWSEIHEIVRKLQPSAIMFSDAGPDCRWVGNEEPLKLPKT